MNDHLRLLILLEGSTVTGPAKNVLEFCRVSKTLEPELTVAPMLAAFVREERGNPGRTDSNDLKVAAAEDGVELHAVPERFAFDPRIIHELVDLCGQLNPHIIETHHVKSHFLVRLSGLWRARRWIAFHHGYTRDARRTAVYNQLDRWSLRAAHKIITVCEPFKQQLVKIGIPEAGITVLHNAIDANWLNGQEDADATVTTHHESGDSRKRERIVLAVGRLSKEKAFNDLIAALGQLRRLRPELLVRLLIVGDGPERQRLEQMTRGRGLQDRVTLLGHVSDPRPYYRKADVVAISSVSEGSPNVVLEAMSAGVPLVATAVGGIPEILSSGETALLVAPQNPTALADAMSVLLSNPDLANRLVRNAREQVSTRFSPRARARSLLDFYSQTCAVPDGWQTH